MAEERIVMYPSPGMGHLVSMVELAKLLLHRRPSLSITILIPSFPFSSTATTSYISAVSSAVPSLSFHHLPLVSLPLPLSSYPNGEHLLFETLRLNTPAVSAALSSASASVMAFVLDIFCSPARPIAAALGIPTFYFFTSGAADLALFLRVPEIHRSTTANFKDLAGKCIEIPSLPPIPFTALPEPMMERTLVYDNFVEFGVQMAEADGIIVNTFEALEETALKVISAGLVLMGRPTPPIYPIGPLINVRERPIEREDCLKWLDLQPRQSVVFLCFGSLGLFSTEQLREISIGLDQSGVRFVWVVRSPPTEDKVKRFMPLPEPDLGSLLPEGFLNRTEGHGLVVKNWVPQMEVLNHESIGGFVTHCGWNSILEAVYAGVPMITWPLYAEQRINKIILVETMKAAIPIAGAEEKMVVPAGEVEKRVVEIMGPKGAMLRERVSKLRDEARVALKEGGPSYIALDKLLELWKK